MANERNNFSDTRYKFREEYLPQPDGSIKRIEYVDITKVGMDKYYEVPMRIVDAKRDTSGLWEHIEAGYNAWLSGQTLPENGTPLSSWSGMPPSMAKALKGFDIKTVEDVASLTEASLQKIGLGGLRDIVRAAKAWVDASDTREIASKLSEKDAQIEAMQEQMAVMMEMLQARDNAEEPVKRRPGRPRKEEAEEAAA